LLAAKLRSDLGKNQIRKMLGVRCSKHFLLQDITSSIREEISLIEE
jgi:hypothetical protein